MTKASYHLKNRCFIISRKHGAHWPELGWRKSDSKFTTYTGFLRFFWLRIDLLISFIHLTNKHFLSTTYLPDAILGSGLSGLYCVDWSVVGQNTSWKCLWMWPMWWTSKHEGHESFRNLCRNPHLLSNNQKKKKGKEILRSVPEFQGVKKKLNLNENRFETTQPQKHNWNLERKPSSC